MTTPHERLLPVTIHLPAFHTLVPGTGPSPSGQPKSRLLGALVGRSIEVRLSSKADVANYDEVFERNIGTRSRLAIPRGLNQLWSQARRGAGRFRRARRQNPGRVGGRN
jgi:hypothetical protein